jgi:hypothetical protein
MVRRLECPDINNVPGRPKIKTLAKPMRLFAVALVAFALALPLPVMAGSDGAATGMDMAMSPDGPVVPAVSGFIDGQPMLFMHTEVSDAGISKILVDMMGGSPVPVVPSLALAPAEMLAPVYVFTNGYGGMGPMGPLGGQPDIFVGAPGQDGYSPLRNVILVTWSDGANIVEMKSYDELRAAIKTGAVTIQEAGVVINMPFLTWPGGSR